MPVGFQDQVKAVRLLSEPVNIIVHSLDEVNLLDVRIDTVANAEGTSQAQSI